MPRSTELALTAYVGPTLLLIRHFMLFFPLICQPSKSVKVTEGVREVCSFLYFPVSYCISKQAFIHMICGQVST